MKAHLELRELGLILVSPPRLGNHEWIIRPIAELGFRAVKHLHAHTLMSEASTGEAGQ